MRNISNNAGFARILPKPGPIERSAGRTELSQFASKWLTFVPPLSQLLAVGHFPISKRSCNFPGISRRLLSIEDHSTGNGKAQPLITKLRAAIASTTKTEGEWPAVGKEDIYLTHKPNVVKARKEKMIMTLADEPL